MNIALNSGYWYQCIQDSLGASKAYRWFINDFCKINTADRILDVGCGASGVLSFINEYASYTGFEPNAEYLLKAKERWGNKGVFHHAGIENFNPGNGSPFTKVLLIGVFHHLNQSQIELLEELFKKCLSSDASIFSLDPYKRAGAGIIEKTLIGMDNGSHILGLPEHLNRFSKFNILKQETKTDLLRVPYSHIALQMRMS